MRSIVHPGPVTPERIQIAPCSGTPLTLELQPGVTLEQAVDAALSLEGFDSVWLELRDAPAKPLRYVIPDHAPDDSHVAWYSETQEFKHGRINRLGMIIGRYNGNTFTHSHGQWIDANGLQAMGHLLATETILSEPVVAKGFGLKGAKFDRRYDPETNFDLFHADSLDDSGNENEYAAVRLLPNQDFATALDTACQQLGWQSARVYGLGSLIGAKFEDGQILDSFATEFLVTDAVAGLEPTEPEIVIVGFDGKQILSGRLYRGKNAVLVTAEIVMHRLSDR